MEPESPGRKAKQEDRAALDAGPIGRFRLMRYFTLATLIVFLAAGLALWLLQREEEAFFERVQRDQQAFFAQAQTRLAQQNEEAARASLLALYEAGHVNLTNVVANLMWANEIEPVVAAAQRLAVEPCRALPAADRAASAAAAPDARRACLAELGRRIRMLPGFEQLDRRAYAAMRATKVFKVKVWDLRGITVYSSEHAQIGDDGAGNAGWRAAVAGQPASELTHRDRFSAFEGVVENRDLISSYVPVREGGDGRVLGVLELYSDVTPYLHQSKAASQRFADISAANDAQIERSARANEQAVREDSREFLLIVGGLLALLYAASLVIVRIGQRFIDRQTLAQQQAAQRERQWHREKMAALAAMAANVSHEVGNPLAVIAGVAQQLPDTVPGTEGAPGRTIMAQTARIAHMMRRITTFADARGTAPETVDVNEVVKAVCDFMAFDRRLRPTPIEFIAGAGLPARELVPDHLNEVMMNLLQACAESVAQRMPGGRVVVETSARGDDVMVRLGCAAADGATAPADPSPVNELRIVPARRRLAEMGAMLVRQSDAVEFALPPEAAQQPH